MLTFSEPLAIRCIDVEKSYSVNPNKRLWRAFLGLPEAREEDLIYALKGVTFDVPKGQIVGILGKNGAGKSTLLRVLGGIYPPSGGQFEVRGQVVGLFELGGVSNPNLTGKEYATRYLRIMGSSTKSLRPLLQDILEFSELGQAFEQRIRTYSAGMAARLYFATATVLQHDIYLIDELLSVGDAHFQAKCWRRMRQRLRNGASGVLVTHDWSAIVRLCERACVLEAGRFIFNGRSDSAVVSYLQLPTPPATAARFLPENCLQHESSQEPDQVITLWLDVLQEGPVDFSFSIEMLCLGSDWEIVLLSRTIPVPKGVGRFRVEIPVSEFPLAAGRYSLNLFLTHRDTQLTLDARSWTYGTAHELIILGEPSRVPVKLPFKARKFKVTK